MATRVSDQSAQMETTDSRGVTKFDPRGMNGRIY